MVATVLTVYGIETQAKNLYMYVRLQMVATVLTVYGIETDKISNIGFANPNVVATVLTVYGIETHRTTHGCGRIDQLQQYLPFTVLKP